MENEFFTAIRLGDVTKLKQLLRNHPEFANAENRDGLTPLGFAAHYGQVNAVKLLLENGADVNAVSHSKIDFIPSNTALHAAIAGERDVDVIKLLLSYHAKTNIFDSNGHTCLHTAAFHDDNIEIIDLLIDHGANVNASYEGGPTCMALAKAKGNRRVVEFLSQKGVMD